jgi:hypothetical protein
MLQMFCQNQKTIALSNVIAHFLKWSRPASGAVSMVVEKDAVGKPFIIPCAHRTAHQRPGCTTWAHGIMNGFPTTSPKRVQ